MSFQLPKTGSFSICQLMAEQWQMGWTSPIC